MILVAQIQLEAALVAIAESKEIAAVSLRRRPRTGAFASRGLDLEDLSAQRPQLAADERSRRVLPNFNYAHAGKRLGLACSLVRKKGALATRGQCFQVGAVFVGGGYA